MTTTWHPVATLRPVTPFSWAQSLRVAGAFPPARGQQVIADAALIRGVLVGDAPIAVRITGDDDALTLAADRPVTAAEHDALIDQITFWLSLDDDLAPFYALARRDPSFAPVAQQLHGLHQVKFPTPFEAAVWAILSQRTHLPIARQHKDALAAAFGATVTADGQTLPIFPDPPAIAGAPPEAVAGAIHNERQTRYVLAAAAAFAEVDAAFLRTAPTPDVTAWLRAIPGVGEWSAGLVLVRGLGRMEHLPPEPRVPGSVVRTYGDPEADMATLAAPYGAWRGYWAYYLRQTAM